MRGIIDEAAQHVADEKIEHNHRQQAGAKRALKSFRQLTTKLDAKNKENSNQPEERARSSRRGSVDSFENETCDRTSAPAGPDSEITRDYAAHSGYYPKHYKLRRTIKLLNIRTDNPKAVHVHDEMQQVDVKEHGRDETPPLMLRLNVVVQLGAERQQHLAW